MNEHTDAHNLAARALSHLQAGTTDQAQGLLTLPIDAYLDTERYDREVQTIFRDTPITLALSVELPAPGTYLARTVLGVPTLLARGQDGTVRAFLNVCRHRGAKLCAEGQGERTRFTCPYHAWTYDEFGALVKLYGGDKFGDFDKRERGLVALNCAERSGIILACLNPQSSFDADKWLGNMQPQLDKLALRDWVLFEQRDLAGPGWKVALDGYLEVYHHDIVHRSTVGQHTIGNLLVHDTFGPHQRLTFGRKTLDTLAGQAPDSWENPEQHIRLIHSVFPNLSISGIVGGQCLVSQIFPGPTLESTVTRQTILCAPGEQNEAWYEAARTFSQLTLEAVRDEDYAIGSRVQEALGSGANQSFLLGRNEIGVQHYHNTVARIMAADSDDRATLGLQKQDSD